MYDLKVTELTSTKLVLECYEEKTDGDKEYSKMTYQKVSTMKVRQFVIILITLLYVDHIYAINPERQKGMRYAVEGHFRSRCIKRGKCHELLALLLL